MCRSVTAFDLAYNKAPTLATPLFTQLLILVNVATTPQSALTKMTTEIRSLVATQFQLMFNSFIDLSKNHGSLIASSNGYHYVLATVILVAIYMAIVNQLRFRRLNAIKKKHGFSDDPKSYENMTPDQAQEIEKNLAEFEMPWLFEFSWLFDFLRVRHDLSVPI